MLPQIFLILTLRETDFARRDECAPLVNLENNLSFGRESIPLEKETSEPSSPCPAQHTLKCFSSPALWNQFYNHTTNPSESLVWMMKSSMDPTFYPNRQLTLLTIISFRAFRRSRNTHTVLLWILGGWLSGPCPCWQWFSCVFLLNQSIALFVSWQNNTGGNTLHLQNTTSIFYSRATLFLCASLELESSDTGGASCRRWRDQSPVWGDRGSGQEGTEEGRSSNTNSWSPREGLFAEF